MSVIALRKSGGGELIMKPDPEGNHTMTVYLTHNDGTLVEGSVYEGMKTVHGLIAYLAMHDLYRGTIADNKRLKGEVESMRAERLERDRTTLAELKGEER